MAETIRPRQSYRPIAYATLIAILLIGCQSPPSKPSIETPVTPAQTPTADLRAEYRALAANGGSVYAIDPTASRVNIYVFRGGLAANAGHNHVLNAPRFEGFVHIPSENPTQTRFDLRVRLDELVIDDPAVRERTGGNFADARSESDIEGTKRNMLGPRGLDAEKFPFVHLKSIAVSGDWPVLVADVAVTLHGVTRQQPVGLHAQYGVNGMIVKGALVLRQTDFDITPYSLFGGVMTVQDAVVVEFDLAGLRTEF